MSKEFPTIRLQRVLQKIEAGSFIPDTKPVTSIGELSRLTQLDIYTILRFLDQGLAVDGKIAETINPASQLKTPQASKTKDQIRSNLESETQRFQRRPQLPLPGTKGKPLCEKITSKTIKNQIFKAPVRLVYPDQSRTEPMRQKAILENQKRLETRYLSIATEQTAVDQANKFISIIESRSVAPIERPGRIKQLALRSIAESSSLNICNWICPAGTPLQADASQNSLYRLYSQTDPEVGFQKDYRLLPRIDQENELLRSFRRANITPNYFKFMADNNPYCIYPTCLDIDGASRTLSAIAQYSEYVQGRLDTLTERGQICVASWKDMLGSTLFGQFLNTYKSTKMEDLLPFLPTNVLETEVDILASHTSIDPKLTPLLTDLAEKVIRQYAVEGLFLYYLFGDNIVLAWNESTRRSGIIDSLRKAKNIPPLPKIYVLYEKKDGQIVNNF